MSSELKDINLREFYLSYFFQTYCEFFNVENQISLIDGRAYTHIYSFMMLFNDIMTSPKYDNIQINLANKDAIDEELDKLDLMAIEHLRSAISEYTTSILYTHKYLKQEVLNSAISCDLITEIINESGQYFIDFASSYNKVFEETGSIYIIDMLIEFNNFLSHILKMLISCDKDDPNKKRGISHLHRGALDGYKYLIHKNAKNPNFITTLKEEFVNLRIKEMNGIGKIEKSKIKLVEDYSEFVSKLLSHIEIDYSPSYENKKETVANMLKLSDF